LENYKIAVATTEKNGLEDSVSDVFGRAKTFTILNTKDSKIIDIEIVENSATSYHHGAGPIAVKTLIDKGVNIVLANELGFGASELLKQHNVKFFPVKPGKRVEDVIKNLLKIRNDNQKFGVIY
jgi:predicted Fe-Mo cluster-binding NifX family protein